MAIKKSELYSSLWASCDELRGGMDASQYKDYVLVMLFIKYVSDKYANTPFAPITVPAGASFTDMVALKGKPDIGDQINKKIIAPLASANKLSDLPDFNDPSKLGSGDEIVERLTNLIGIFENKALDFSKNRADGDDILGDAYEYLMRHFATESGKSKGQFYTPAEVSRIMAQILGIKEANTTNETTVYDPTCGSGSLLLKVADEATANVTLYGQEKDTATSGLARMNMILHNNPTADIKGGYSTLASPAFMDDHGKLKTFDYVVANPPFSDKRWSTGFSPDNDVHERFGHYGIPPAKQGDYAYLLHIIRSLKSTGKGACILPHGVLFRGNAEGDIRKNLIRRGYIKGIIGLPANLFYGTGIPACIVVIDKAEAQARKGIFMIDASAGFIKDGPKNRLREQDLHKIVDVFNKKLELPKYSRMVSLEEIEKNEFNLNLPRYIDDQQAEDLQDIEGHLKGGIPSRDVDALQAYWQVCPQLQQALFKPNRADYVDLAIPKQQIKASIYQHPQFAGFITQMNAHFATWREATSAQLKHLQSGFHPKQLINALGEQLLTHYDNKPLIDKYDVYQHLMNYWAETMQDDGYLIAADGWKAQTYRIIEKGKNGKEKDKGWTCDLIPKQLIVDAYFAKEQQAINEQTAELESDTSRLTDLEEEHGSDEGILKSVNTAKDFDEAWHEAKCLVWSELNNQGFKDYTQSKTYIDQCYLKIKILDDEPILQSLKNAKGKITKAELNKIMKLKNHDEVSKLTGEYIQLLDAITSSKLKLMALDNRVETQINELIKTEPNNDLITDFIALKNWQSLTNQIAKLKKAIKDAEAELDLKAYNQYPKLTEAEIKILVVDNKWLSAVDVLVHGEMDRISQTLTHRVKELAERYETPMPILAKSVIDLETKVQEHLVKMGFAWN